MFSDDNRCKPDGVRCVLLMFLRHIMHWLHDNLLLVTSRCLHEKCNASMPPGDSCSCELLHIQVGNRVAWSAMTASVMHCKK